MPIPLRKKPPLVTSGHLQIFLPFRVCDGGRPQGPPRGVPAIENDTGNSGLLRNGNMVEQHRVQHGIVVRGYREAHINAFAHGNRDAVHVLPVFSIR